jgi:hypothetical protein
MTKCGEFLAVGHEFGTFAELDAKNLVVGAGQQGIGGIVIRFVAFHTTIRSSRMMADLLSFDSARLMPPPSQSTPQPKRTSLPASSAMT